MTSNALKQEAKEKAAQVKKETLYTGRLFSVEKDTLSFPGEPDHSLDLVIHPGAVVILPLTAQNTILLIKQWRRAAGKILFELPAGTLEEGEDPLLCARREIQEECDVKAEKWTFLGGFYSAPGFCSEYLHFYLAQELHASSLPGDDHEAIDIVEVSIQKAVEMISTGEIIDLKTIAGILRYKEEFQ